MQYEVVYAQGDNMGSTVSELEKEVERLCRNGWKPQGGITITTSPFKMCYACQAMVK